MQKVRDATASVLDDCTLADALGQRPAAYRAHDLGKAARRRPDLPGGRRPTPNSRGGESARHLAKPDKTTLRSRTQPG
jgi:hypothetical protein